MHVIRQYGLPEVRYIYIVLRYDVAFPLLTHPFAFGHAKTVIV